MANQILRDEGVKFKIVIEVNQVCQAQQSLSNDALVVQELPVAQKIDHQRIIMIQIIDVIHIIMLLLTKVVQKDSQQTFKASKVYFQAQNNKDRWRVQ